MVSPPAMQLECRQTAFRYPGTKSAVFEKLSFRMPGPGFNALFGPSGVGKTSLARILTGELSAFTGFAVDLDLTSHYFDQPFADG